MKKTAAIFKLVWGGGKENTTCCTFSDGKNSIKGKSQLIKMEKMHFGPYKPGNPNETV